MSKKWTDDNVTVMWGLLREHMGTRPKIHCDEWWKKVAVHVAAATKLEGLTGGAIYNKAMEERRSKKRLLPWEETDSPTTVKVESKVPVSALHAAVQGVRDEIAKLRNEMLDRLEDRLSPTPDVQVTIGQLWTTRVRPTAPNGKSGVLRVVAIHDDVGEVCLKDIAAEFEHQLPIRRLLQHFSYVASGTPATVVSREAFGTPPPSSREITAAVKVPPYEDTLRALLG